MLSNNLIWECHKFFNDDFYSTLKGTAGKMSKQQEAQFLELQAKSEESVRTITELNSQRGRLQQETADLTRQIEEAEHRVSVLAKEKQQLSSQLEEARSSLEDESRVSII